jgi:hypothetical protein
MLINITPEEPVIEKFEAAAPEKTPEVVKLNIDYPMAAAIARQEALRDGFRGCITTTRILIDALKMLGVHAEPMSVQAIIMNPFVAGKMAKRTLSKKALESYINDRKGWSLGIGFPAARPDESSWEGHLVAIVPTSEGIVLLDPTLDQASRPEKNIRLYPLGIEVKEGFFQGKNQITVVNNCSVTYKARMDDRSFESIEDWTTLNISAAVMRTFERLAGVFGIQRG